MNLLFPPRRGLARRRDNGVALVIVLAIIVLITVLVVGLLVRAGAERTATVSQAASTACFRLADSVVNLVQAQITDAATQTNALWAAQPGAIRVFDSSGNLQYIYRLYSGTSLAETSYAGIQADVPPGSWAAEPAVWVDLNAPTTVPGIKDSSGADLKAFPILDPRDPVDPTKIATLGGGFSITNAPGSTTNQPAPMPVRWLYVLANGEFVAPTNPTGNTVTIAGATAANPVVGRVAFWADDESARVNVNTAGDGTFWDVPRFDAADDKTLLAKNQPAAGEYQRYPGHPATTSLRTILESVGLSLGTYPSTTGTSSVIFKLLPRYNDDRGSKEGTVVPSATPSPKNERLYSAIGEMLYAPDRSVSTLTRAGLETAKFFLTTQSRAPEVTVFGTPRVSMWPVHESISASPSSPSTSAYDRLAAFCSSLGSSGQYKYYFQRKNADSPTADYEDIGRNRQLYAYLQDLTGRTVPGYGGSFATKYPDDRNQILTEIFDYIRSSNLYDATIDPSGTSGYQFTDADGPGYGQVAPIRIADTQGFGRFFTISEIGLLVICTAEGGGPAPDQNGSANDARSVSNLADPEYLKTTAGVTVDLNYQPSSTGAPKFPANPTLAPDFGGTKTALVAGQKRLQAMLVFELTSPMHGYTALKPNFEVRVAGIQAITLDGQTPFPATANGTITGATRKIGGTTETGGVNGVRFAVALDSSGRVNGWRYPADANRYPFVSNPFTVAGNSLSVSTSSPFTIELLLKQSNGSASQLVQTFNVSFPSLSVPVPDLLNYGVYSSSIPNVASDWWGFDKRISWVNETSGNTGQQTEGPGALFRSDPKTPTDVIAGDWQLNLSGGTKDYKAFGTKSDVVFSIMPKGGDVRLIAGRAVVPASTDSVDSLFVLHPLANASNKFAHSFMEAVNTKTMTGVSTNGKLVSGANYESRRAPDVPGDVSALAGTGDWDNGLPGVADGGYVNKADEGNIYKLSTQVPYYETLGQQKDLDATFFTPNRIVPSPVMLGSLSTGVKSRTPWRTLLFRPAPNNHPAASVSPPDYLMLDLFNMPVVEPYAISEPFSTAGKINMNYQILPFTYISRSAGMRAVLNDERVTKIPKSMAGSYKVADAVASSISQARFPLNLSETDGTLRQFKQKFDAGEIFKSAAEICDIFLVPQGEAWTSDSDAKAKWYGDNFALVGDNTRERPYAHLYPRLTTKSNTFTVYYTVQALKNPGTNPAEWNESRGKINGQLRGSTTVERYLDPTNASIRDYASDPTADSLDNYYRWRILATRRFAP